MIRSRLSQTMLLPVVFLGAAAFLGAQNPVTDTARDVNRKMVKLFGAGGFKGLPSYGTGILISPKGYILTCNNHILLTSDLRVHLYDGRSYHAKVLAKEPDLDLAICKIEEDVDFLPHYDLQKEAARPLAEAGDSILAHSNCFQVATRDEPMSVQRGVIASYAELRGRRGVFDAPYSGDVYFIDVIANNPGAAGGALTNRKGDLLGVIGRELKNALTDTWINYAVPVQSFIPDYEHKGKKLKLDLPTFAKLTMDGEFIAREKTKREERGGYTGLVLVPNPVSATPPYVEEVVPGSPAASAGLRADDLIVYVDGQLVPTIRDYRDIVRFVPVNESVKLDVQRGTKMMNFTVKIADPPAVKLVDAPK